MAMLPTESTRSTPTAVACRRSSASTLAAVASVLRNVTTVEDGEWMGIYLKDGKFYDSPIHTVHSLEAVGAGDAFAGGLLHSLIHGFDPQKLIDFSITASVMKLMIQHDFNLVSEEEILRIMKTGETNVIR